MTNTRYHAHPPRLLLTGTLRGGLVNMMAAPLLKAKALKCGQAVVKVEERPGTAKVTVTLASGKTHEADLVRLPPSFLTSPPFLCHNVESGSSCSCVLLHTFSTFSLGGGRGRHQQHAGTLAARRGHGSTFVLGVLHFFWRH